MPPRALTAGQLTGSRNPNRSGDWLTRWLRLLFWPVRAEQARQRNGAARARSSAGEASVPASLVPKRTVDGAVAGFTAVYDKRWRHALRMLLRDEIDRKWRLPLGVMILERVGPQGVQWMLLHDDPFVADWAAEWLEKRLKAGKKDPTFVLRQLDDGKSRSEDDAGLTIVAGVWVAAAANSAPARQQMGRILLAILYAIRRSACDEHGRLGVPTSSPGELAEAG